MGGTWDGFTVVVFVVAAVAAVAAAAAPRRVGLHHTVRRAVEG